MSDRDHDELHNPTPTPKKNAPPSRTPEGWREFLRADELPDEIADLPFRQRRRVRRAWRSARRDARARWVKAERRKVPTPLSVPIILLVVAGLVAGASWLNSHDDRDTVQTKPPATYSATPAPQEDTPSPAASASRTVRRPGTPDGIAKAFVLAYTTRMPLQDGTHSAAVERAAPYASTALADNLNKHDDIDWNKLVAAQATSATPTQVSINPPASKKEFAPDTPVRVYRDATAHIEVKGTDNYTYTRHLTLEVSRADVGQPWMVTRVVGLEE
ncbi:MULTISPECIES: hypothetical protein [Streptomyces]|uniref:Uncharacterized protein n=1 Tax=Streptomyces zinciresistens K42 TaxID=700597 RepID=G2GDD9_9ACTN|nr:MULTISPECIES: hypothetical protein [Streptomyces]EGX58471.1 hypothetical protein SZN_17582 [Streptomyces zinciresistens K42]MDT9695831.1 hypothetical protein [Streptomyces sp. P17]